MRFVLVLLLLTTGCVYVALKPGAERVEIVLDPSAPDPPRPDCVLKEETYKVPMGGWATSPTDERSRAVMQNHALDLGANVIRAQPLGQRWYLKYYRCETPRP
jgi:hypothetical protein